MMSDANTRCKDFKVAIVGGGMCGLAVAVGLGQGGIDVEIYEAAVINTLCMFMQRLITADSLALAK